MVSRGIRFGLNERQIELVSRATPKRHYYLQPARGNRLFELPIRLLVAAMHDISVAMIEKHYSRWIADGLEEMAAQAIVPLRRMVT